MSAEANITVTCPACSTDIEIEPSDYATLQGSTFACPACQATLAIPAAPPATAAAPAPTPRTPTSAPPAAQSTYNSVFGRKCEGCGAALPPGLSACPACGKRLGRRGKLGAGRRMQASFASRGAQAGPWWQVPLDWLRRSSGLFALLAVLLIGWHLRNRIQQGAQEREEVAFYATVEAQVAGAPTWEQQIGILRGFLARYPMGPRAEAAADMIAQLEQEQRAAGFDVELQLDVTLGHGGTLPFEGRTEILAVKASPDDLRKALDREPDIRRLRSSAPNEPQRRLELFDAIGIALAARQPEVIASGITSNGIARFGGMPAGNYILYGAGTAGPNRVGIFSTLIVRPDPGETEFFPEYFAAFETSGRPANPKP